MGAKDAATPCNSSVSPLSLSLVSVVDPPPVSGETEDVASDGGVGNSAGFLRGEDDGDEVAFTSEGSKTLSEESPMDDFCGGVVEGSGSLVLEKLGFSDGADGVDPNPKEKGALAGEERDLVSEEGCDAVSALSFLAVVESTERKEEEEVNAVAMGGSEVGDDDFDGKIELQDNSENTEAAGSGIFEAAPEKKSDLNAQSHTEPVEGETDDESLEFRKADTAETEEIDTSIPPHKLDGTGCIGADEGPSVGVQIADQVVVENSLREYGEFSFVTESGDDTSTNLTLESGKEGSAFLESVPEAAGEIIDIKDWDLKEKDGNLRPESRDSMQESRHNHEDSSRSPEVFLPVISSLESSNLLELQGGSEATNSSDEPKKLNLMDELKKLVNLSGGSSVGVSDGGPIMMSDSDEAVHTEDDDDDDGDDGEDDKVLFDSAALTALLKAAGAASEGTNAGSENTSNLFSGKGPAGLGSSIPMLRPSAPRQSRSDIVSPFDSSAREPETESMNDEEKKLGEKINSVRVKFLRLVHRLGHSPEETVVAQVLYRLGLAEGMPRGRSGLRPFRLDHARETAVKLEEGGKDDLEFSCTILLIGKTGVGKSATINSILGDDKAPTGAFQPTTSTVREITGVVNGVKIRLIDTPGLNPSVMEQGNNGKILSSVKKSIKKFQPDIVLYLDRMDARARDSNDLPLLRSITSYLGASIWFNAIVALTHASSAPPDGPNGTPLTYDTAVSQRSHAVQHSIRQAAGDMRLMNPVALVENHPSCRRNRAGQRVLPNGQAWRSQLLLLCYSTKILSEANSLLKLQEPFTGKFHFGGLRYRSAPLPFLLSSLLQSRPHPKLASADQGGDDSFDSDSELSDADADEEGDEYDQLPPFKPLRKSQIAKLSKEQRNAYFEEYEYRVKLLQKKQLKEHLRQRRESKKHQQGGDSATGVNEFDDESGGPAAAVAVPLPDMVLPPSFDGDNPAYRYRFLEPTGSQLLTRPVLDNHGWDHDCGYDGVSLEGNLALAGRFPAGVSVQITKDKKDFNIHVDSSVSMKHGEHGSTMAGFDVQTVGKQLAYIFRSESKFKNFKKNKTAAGLSFTLIGEKLASGIKIEDQILIGKRANLSASVGMIRAQSDAAYGANLEARIMEKDFPIGQDSTTLGLSLMRWRSDLALGANLQTQFSIGRGMKMAVRVGLNNKLSGQITVRTSSSEQLQIALMGLLPLAVSMYRTMLVGASESLR